MRQRLLLIAGWAVAAVGSSVVASGAVAVAGGQVTDRPLRLLSASEVEAIPIVNTVVRQATTTSSLPPEARDTSGSPEREGADLTMGTLTDRQSPAGDGGGSGSPPLADLLPEEDTAPGTGADLVEQPGDGTDDRDPVSGDRAPPAVPDPEQDGSQPVAGGPGDDFEPSEADPPPPPPAPGPGTQIVTMPGGSAAVAGADGRVELLWATPRAGYTVSIDFSAPDALVVSFVSPTAESVLRAFWSDEGLVVDAPDAIS